MVWWLLFLLLGCVFAVAFCSLGDRPFLGQLLLLLFFLLPAFSSTAVFAFFSCCGVVVVVVCLFVCLFVGGFCLFWQWCL